MPTIDLILLGIVGLSAVIGMFRGFFPELLSLATWIVAVWAGWNFAGSVEPYLAGALQSPVLELWLARAIVFVGVLLVGGLLGQVVALVIARTGLTGTNRALGLLFGLLRGGVILGVLTMFAQNLELSQAPWWGESTVIPHAEQIAGWVRTVLPDDVARFLPPEAEPDSATVEALALPQPADGLP